MNTARSAALKALIQYRRDGAWTDLTLKNLLSDLSGEDAALATAITYGVLQNLYLIDYYIGSYSNIKLTKIMPQVLDALRCGVYQIIFMDRIPSFAAVNETVNLAKKYGNPRAGAFVNAILRKVVSNKNELPDIKCDDPVSCLSTLYSHPQWLVKKYIDQFGYEETKELLSANNTAAPVYIRVNTIKTDADSLEKSLCNAGVELKQVDGVPGAFICRSPIPLQHTDDFKKGMFYIQDLASQLAVMLLNPDPCDTLVDMCAAPGGKSLLAAQYMANNGKIISFDIHQHKIDIIRQNAEKYGVSILNASVSDSSVLVPELVGKCDKVICDVPCSGLGIIRKKPDIRFKSPESIRSLPDIQYDILQNAAAYLKPGGRLVYSTCTIIREENEDVIKRFLADSDDFSLSAFNTAVTGQTDGFVTLMPNKHNCDGFFIAVLDRKKV